LLLWLRERRRGRLIRAGNVRFYRRVMTALSRQGVHRLAAETPREFARRVEQSIPRIDGLFLELIERYYAARFGGIGPVEAGEHLSQQVLARLGDNRKHTNSAGENTISPSSR
jgi:hypothetical protein